MHLRSYIFITIHKVLDRCDVDCFYDCMLTVINLVWEYLAFRSRILVNAWKQFSGTNSKTNRPHPGTMGPQGADITHFIVF